jgi:hypothetical protein
MGRIAALVALAVLAATGSTAPAQSPGASAPCRLCDSGDASDSEVPAAPVTLDVQTSLDFDRLILVGSGEGSAELGPDGSRIVSGSIAAIGARAMVGAVVIRGEPGRPVRNVLPARIELFGLSGGTITVDTIRSDLPQMPRLGADGTLSFRFGGILRLSGELDGDFRGDVPIEVEYF